MKYVCSGGLGENGHRDRQVTLTTRCRQGNEGPGHCSNKPLGRCPYHPLGSRLSPQAVLPRYSICLIPQGIRDQPFPHGSYPAREGGGTEARYFHTASTWRKSVPAAPYLAQLRLPWPLPGEYRSPRRLTWLSSGSHGPYLEKIGPPRRVPGAHQPPEASTWRKSAPRGAYPAQISPPQHLPGENRSPGGPTRRKSAPRGAYPAQMLVHLG